MEADKGILVMYPSPHHPFFLLFPAELQSPPPLRSPEFLEQPNSNPTWVQSICGDVFLCRLGFSSPYPTARRCPPYAPTMGGTYPAQVLQDLPKAYSSNQADGIAHSIVMPSGLANGEGAARPVAETAPDSPGS